jgi:putative membrane protein
MVDNQSSALLLLANGGKGMNFVSKIVGAIVFLIVFVLFFGFALKNVQIVTLQYFWGYAQSAPLVLWLFGFFLLGVVLTLLAMVPMVFRHRGDISKHKKTIAEIEKERLAAQLSGMSAPQSDSIRNT